MPKPLHVTHVVFSLDVGGLERNVVNQVREGQALGETVSVVCLDRPGELAPRVEALGGKVVSLDRRPGIQLSLILRMRAVFKELRPDIVHTHQIPTLFYAGPAARTVGGARVVHTEHGLPPLANRATTRWLSWLSCLHCGVFYCLTREIAAELTKYRIVSGRKIRMIRNGIDTASYRERGDPRTLRESLGIPAAATVIGSVGRLAEIKRFDMLIRAFGEVNRHLPDAHLLIVGDGPKRVELEQFAEGLGLGKRVHFAGYQTNVTEYLHAMDCFALTSSSEGMPQAVLEASIAGLPVVASRVGGLPEVIDDGRTGVLFSPNDEEALTRELLGIVRNKERASQLGDAARAHVQSSYGVGRMAKEYHDDYLQLLDNRV